MAYVTALVSSCRTRTTYRFLGANPHSSSSVGREAVVVGRVDGHTPPPGYSGNFGCKHLPRYNALSPTDVFNFASPFFDGLRVKNDSQVHILSVLLILFFDWIAPNPQRAQNKYCQQSQSLFRDSTLFTCPSLPFISCHRPLLCLSSVHIHSVCT